MLVRISLKYHSTYLFSCKQHVHRHTENAETMVHNCQNLQLKRVLQPAPPDSLVASMSEISNSTMQQHTPGLEFSTASTSDISDTLQQQQHAADLGMATSDFKYVRHK